MGRGLNFLDAVDGRVITPRKRLELSKSSEISKHPEPIYSPKSLAHGESRVYEIPSVLAGNRFTEALGDSGARHNFMKEGFAKRSGFSINRSVTIDVKVGSGKKVATTGTIETSYQFLGESEKHRLVFHLLPTCVHDVILGNPFLKFTKTLTRNLSRIKEKIVKGFVDRHFLYLGNSAPRFSGLLNGTPQEVLADSGAKVMVMDEKHAQNLGITIMRDKEYRTRLRFADGSTAKTSGMAHGVEWQFGPGGIDQKYQLDFHVLKNAPAKVILNDSFLFDTKAFLNYDCYLTDDDDEDEDAYFFVINVDTRYQRNGPSSANRAHTELIRRAEEEDRIENLPLDEQDDAWILERERRTQWRRQQNLVQNGSTSPLHSSSNPATSSQSIQMQQGAVAPNTRWRTRWQLKLKRTKRA
ncbi:hypothetical protein PSPO01_10131 [Paraphaeosphaeria sporulosa]